MVVVVGGGGTAKVTVLMLSFNFTPVNVASSGSTLKSRVTLVWFRDGSS